MFGTSDANIGENDDYDDDHECTQNWNGELWLKIVWRIVIVAEHFALRH